MKNLVVTYLVAVSCQFIAAQVLRPPYNFINRPGAEKIIEASRFVPPQSPTIISEPAINSFVPLKNREHYSVSEPRTTIITDCSPTICKNLVDTIQLMIACNLLQNKGNSEMAVQLATPIVNQALTSTSQSCGCANSISPTPTNVISPRAISPNFVTPITKTPYSSNILGSNALQLSPTILTQNGYPNGVMPISPTVPMTGQMANTNDLLNTLAGLLGSVKV